MKSPAAIGLLLVAAVAVVHFARVPVLDRAGLMVFDAYQRAAPRPYEDAAVRIVDIDEESIERLGQWPWPRTEIARLTDTLTEAGAAAIAFDIVFSEPDRTSPEKLAEQLQAGGADDALVQALSGLPSNDSVLADSFALSPVIGGYFLLNEERGGALDVPAGMAWLGTAPSMVQPDYRGSVQSLPELQQNAAGLGSLSINKGEDGVVRRAPLLFYHRGELIPSLSLEALRVAQQADSILVQTSDGSGETAGAPGAVVSVKVGDFEVPTNESGEMWSHFTDPQPDRTVPAWKALSPDVSAEEKEQRFAGQIVFVGASAAGLRDVIATPANDREPGVMVHAQAAEQMILGWFLQRPDWGRGVEFALIILLGGALALILPKVGAMAGAVFGLAGVAGVAGGSWAAFDGWRFLLDPTYPIATLVLVYAAQTLLSFRQEEQQRAYIHDAFDRYLSPEMVSQIADNPDKLQLGGEEREMTVLFCDIRGFSKISEQYEPQEVINFLTGFLTPMCDILLERKATVDKFIGDAILAFWNAPLDDPDQFRNGARSALQMVSALEQLNESMPGHDGQIWPEGVKIGIGLNAGLCCVGNMGSEQRLSYSLIGDTVNIASRFEGLTKQYGVEIIVGSTLAQQLEGFALLELDRVKVVGRDAPDTIFALLGDEDVAGQEGFASLKAAHTQFLDAYRTQQWTAAIGTLDAAATDYEAHNLSALAQIYRDRIASLKGAPPAPDWDGTFEATQK